MISCIKKNQNLNIIRRELRESYYGYEEDNGRNKYSCM